MNEENMLERAKESEGLDAILFSFGVLGYEEDINGPGAILVDFKPTRAELMTLAWEYLERIVSVEKYHATGYSGSSSIRESAFCFRRFESIAEALSPDKPIPEFEEFIAQQSKEIEEIREEYEKLGKEYEERKRSEAEEANRQP